MTGRCEVVVIILCLYTFMRYFWITNVTKPRRPNVVS